MAAQPVPWRMVLNSPPANADALDPLEVDLALVGDHRPLAGHHLAVEGDPQHARVLEGEDLARGGHLEVAAEQLTAHPNPLPSWTRALVPEPGGDVQHPGPAGAPAVARSSAGF
jgi:hypothetical protein